VYVARVLGQRAAYVAVVTTAELDRWEEAGADAATVLAELSLDTVAGASSRRSA
jgi:hypothetical protein